MFLYAPKNIEPEPVFWVSCNCIPTTCRLGVYYLDIPCVHLLAGKCNGRREDSKKEIRAKKYCRRKGKCLLQSMIPFVLK
jgi:hypothetical protein